MGRSQACKYRAHTTHYRSAIYPACKCRPQACKYRAYHALSVGYIACKCRPLSRLEIGKWKLESGKWKPESGKWKSETRSGMAPLGHGTSALAAQRNKYFWPELYKRQTSGAFDALKLGRIMIFMVSAARKGARCSIRILFRQTEPRRILMCRGVCEYNTV